ncbi:hypothetical protein [Marinobacter azerbaijanicus]|uniref:hypothetical protein n=1 Tax=Marinobacter azerbaijanicus TaxID=3050455 RepID=UPI003BF5F5D7
MHSHALQYDGQPAELVLAHDITDRLQAEAALRHSEAEFRGNRPSQASGACMADAER